MRTSSKLKHSSKAVLTLGTICFSIQLRAQPILELWSMVNTRLSCRSISIHSVEIHKAGMSNRPLLVLSSKLNEQGYLASQALLQVHDPIYLHGTINYNGLKNSILPRWIMESNFTYRLADHWQGVLGYYYSTHQNGCNLSINYRLFSKSNECTLPRFASRKFLNPPQESRISSSPTDPTIQTISGHHRIATQQTSHFPAQTLPEHIALFSPRQAPSNAVNRTASYTLEARATQPICRVIPNIRNLTHMSTPQLRRIPVTDASSTELVRSTPTSAPRPLFPFQATEHVGIHHQGNSNLAVPSRIAMDPQISLPPVISSETPTEAGWMVLGGVLTDTYILPSSLARGHQRIFSELQPLPQPAERTSNAKPHILGSENRVRVPSERTPAKASKIPFTATNHIAKPSRPSKPFERYTCKPIHLGQDQEDKLNPTLIIRGYTIDELDRKIFFLPKFLKVVDTNLEVLQERMAYDLSRHGKINEFKSHPDFKAYDEELTQSLITISNALPAYLSSTRKDNLRTRLLAFKETMYAESFCEGNEYDVLRVMKLYLYNIAHLLHDLNKHDNSSDRNCLITCIEHLDICHNGIITYLKKTYDELLYNSIGFEGVIQKTKDNIIYAGITEFINKMHQAKAGDLGNYRELDLHFLNSYKNRVHKKWGVSLQTDSFQSLCTSISPFYVQECDAYLEKLISPNNFIEQLIQSYIQEAEAHWNQRLPKESSIEKASRLTQYIDEKFPHLCAHDFIIEDFSNGDLNFLFKPDAGLIYIKTLKLMQAHEYIKFYDLDDSSVHTDRKTLIYLGDHAWLEQNGVPSRLEASELNHYKISSLPLAAWYTMLSNSDEESVKALSAEWISPVERNINFSHQLIAKPIPLSVYLNGLKSLDLPIPACNPAGELWIAKILENKSFDLLEKVLLDPWYQAIQLNVKDKYGFTILHWLARYNQSNWIKFCLSLPNIEVDAVSYKERYTPLTYAVLHQAYECGQLLISASKKINQINLSGDNILGLVIKSDHDTTLNTASIQLLKEAIKHGLNINLLNNAKLSPLHLSILHKKKYILDFLIGEPGTNINIRSGKSNKLGTPLAYAAAKNDFDSMCTLINAKADLDVLDEAGNNALSITILVGSPKSAALLVNSGARLDWLSAEKNSLLQLAFECGQDWIAKLIENKLPHKMLLNVNKYNNSALNTAIFCPRVGIHHILNLCKRELALFNLMEATDPFETAIKVSSAEKFSALQNYVIKHSDYPKHIPHKLWDALKNDRFEQFSELLIQIDSVPALKSSYLNTPLDIDRNTLLHKIVLMNQPRYLNLCLSWLKAYPLACNLLQETPLHIAFKAKAAREIILACLPYFSLDVADAFGNTPLHYVEEGFDLSLLEEVITLGKFNLLRRNSYSVSLFNHLFLHANKEIKDLLVGRLIAQALSSCSLNG